MSAGWWVAGSGLRRSSLLLLTACVPLLFWQPPGLLRPQAHARPVGSRCRSLPMPPWRFMPASWLQIRSTGLDCGGRSELAESGHCLMSGERCAGPAGCLVFSAGCCCCRCCRCSRCCCCCYCCYSSTSYDGSVAELMHMLAVRWLGSHSYFTG